MEPNVACPAGGANAPRVRVRAGSSEKRSGVVEPSAVIFEEDGLRAANAIASHKTDGPRAAAQIDMHLEISHRGRIQLFV
jgi:hypothetical protein